MKRGCLLLSSLDSFAMTFLGQKTYSGDYTASVVIDPKQSTAAVGVAAIGDERNAVAAVYNNGMVQVIMLKDGKETILAQDTARIFNKRRLPVLIMEVHNGSKISFKYSQVGQFPMPLNQQPIDGSFLPPWDRAVRAGLVVKGKGVGAFEAFRLFDY